MPGSRTQTETHAGMTFTMLRSVDPLFQGKAERQLVSERLLELAEGARVVAAVDPSLRSLEPQLRSIQAELDAAFEVA